MKLFLIASIVGAMLFFGYAEVEIIRSKLTRVEKTVCGVVFFFIELYYILQLCQNVGL